MSVTMSGHTNEAHFMTIRQANNKISQSYRANPTGIVNNAFN